MHRQKGGIRGMDSDACNGLGLRSSSRKLQPRPAAETSQSSPASLPNLTHIPWARPQLHSRFAAWVAPAGWGGVGWGGGTGQTTPRALATWRVIDHLPGAQTMCKRPCHPLVLLALLHRPGPFIFHTRPAPLSATPAHRRLLTTTGLLPVAAPAGQGLGLRHPLTRQQCRTGSLLPPLQERTKQANSALSTASKLAKPSAATICCRLTANPGPPPLPSGRLRRVARRGGRRARPPCTTSVVPAITAASGICENKTWQAVKTACAQGRPGLHIHSGCGCWLEREARVRARTAA